MIVIYNIKDISPIGSSTKLLVPFMDASSNLRHARNPGWVV